MSDSEKSKSTSSISREQFEQARMTRREALRKFGLTSAMATFALFSIDDLARLAGRTLERNAGDNRVAGQVAAELRGAGMAFATPTSYGGYAGPCTAFAAGYTSYCGDCNAERTIACATACPSYPALEYYSPCGACELAGGAVCLEKTPSWSNFEDAWSLCAACVRI